MNLRRIISTTISKEMDDLVCRILNFKREGVLKKKLLKTINIMICIFLANLKQTHENVRKTKSRQKYRCSIVAVDSTN